MKGIGFLQTGVERTSRKYRASIKTTESRKTEILRGRTRSSTELEKGGEGFFAQKRWKRSRKPKKKASSRLEVSGRRLTSSMPLFLRNLGKKDSETTKGVERPKLPETIRGYELTRDLMSKDNHRRGSLGMVPTGCQGFGQKTRDKGNYGGELHIEAGGTTLRRKNRGRESLFH